jgi:hypothetical protein
MSHAADGAPIGLLDLLRQNREKTWEELAPRYGVTSPEPPWKVGLTATCECLAARTTLPSLERRHEEDRLGETLYRDVPAPEQQLLALAHIMLERRMLSEADLAERMAAVRARLESA